MVRRMVPYLVAGVATVALVASLLANRSDGEQAAAEDFLQGRQLRVMAPADPGGGWDQTAREMQASLRDIVGRTEVYNVGGAGGTIGLSQFARREGQPTELMMTGLIMLGAIESNKSPVSLAQTTPLARLTTDYEVIVVPEKSSLRSMQDLVAAMRKDVAKVSIAGGSAGGVEQILAGEVADAIDADPSKVNYIAHSGGGEALTTVLSGRATAGVSGVSELAPQIEAGQVRALAVSSPERLPDLPDVPTLKESDVDVELANWRGVVAPAGISAADRAALEDVITTMTSGQQWKDTLARRGWGDATLVGPEFGAFITEEQGRVKQVLAKIGLG